MAKTQAERVGDTRQSICDAVVGLLEEFDYDDITVRQVTETAGVSRTTFYRYFDSVADVVTVIMNRIFDQMKYINRLALMTRVGENPTKPSSTLIMRAEILLECRREFLALIGPHGTPEFKRVGDAIMRDYFTQKMEISGISKKEKPLYIEFIVSGHDALMEMWLRNYPEMPPEHLASLINRLFYAPLLSK